MVLSSLPSGAFVFPQVGAERRLDEQPQCMHLVLHTNCFCWCNAELGSFSRAIPVVLSWACLGVVWVMSRGLRLTLRVRYGVSCGTSGRVVNLTLERNGLWAPSGSWHCSGGPA